MDATVAELAGLFGEGRVHGCACDVATPDGREKLVASVGKITDDGPLDVLVNNVGCNVRKRVAEATTDECESATTPLPSRISG